MSGLVASELEAMTVKTLKQMLSDRSLKVGGRKAELIERLLEFDKAECNDTVDDKVVVDDDNNVVDNNTDDIDDTIDAPVEVEAATVVSDAVREQVCERAGNELVGEVVEEMVMDTFDEVFDSSLDEERTSTSSLKATLVQRQSLATDDAHELVDTAADDDDDDDEVVTVNISAAAASAIADQSPIVAPVVAAAPVDDTTTDSIADIAAERELGSDLSGALSMAPASLSPTMLLDGVPAADASLLLHGDSFSSTSISPAESPYQRSAASSAKKAASATRTPAPAESQPASSSMRIGARVTVALGDKRLLGTLKYAGQTDFAADEWIGVHLDEAAGKHDGTVQGVRYFHCPSNHGLFVRASAVTLAPPRDATPAASSAPAKPKVLSAKSASATNVSSNNTNTTQPSAATAALAVGMRVGIKGRGQQAIVRFIGTTKFADGEWCGLELQCANGKNDGSVNGHKYFSCAAKHGLFVPTSQVAPINGSSSSAKHQSQSQSTSSSSNSIRTN
jgi:hypothetical protein